MKCVVLNTMGGICWLVKLCVKRIRFLWRREIRLAYGIVVAALGAGRLRYGKQCRFMQLEAVNAEGERERERKREAEREREIFVCWAYVLTVAYTSLWVVPATAPASA